MASAGVFVPSVLADPLSQGEVLSGLHRVRVDPSSFGGQAILIETPIEFAIILTQSCDLDQKIATRSGDILVCPLKRVDDVKKAGGMNAGLFKQVRQNQIGRFQFFDAVAAEVDLQGAGLPELVADFRECYSIPTDELLARLQLGAARRCRLQSPFLEHFSNRFGFNQMRVALPADGVLVAADVPPAADATTEKR